MESLSSLNSFRSVAFRNSSKGLLTAVKSKKKQKQLSNIKICDLKLNIVNICCCLYKRISLETSETSVPHTGLQIFVEIFAISRHIAPLFSRAIKIFIFPVTWKRIFASVWLCLWVSCLTVETYQKVCESVRTANRQVWYLAQQTSLHTHTHTHMCYIYQVCMQIPLYSLWYIAQAIYTFLMLKTPSKQPVCHSRRVKLALNAPKTRRNLGLQT